MKVMRSSASKASNDDFPINRNGAILKPLSSSSKMRSNMVKGVEAIVYDRSKDSTSIALTSQSANKSVDERGVRHMILVKALSSLLKSLIKKNFLFWARMYSSRYNKTLFIRSNAAASDIQNWYRNIRFSSRQSWKSLQHAIKMCLHRRKAIKKLLQFEQARRQALIKVHKCIALKRRCHYGTRSLQRVTRWRILLKKASYRIIRSIACRRIQRWRRMIMCRPARELMVMRLIIRLGGYSIVYPKVPVRHISRGFFDGVNACVSQLQKAWFVSKGQAALFMLFAARRAREAYEQMRNENSMIIQNSYRAHLWIKLMLAAITNNRARRITKSFRHYQYREYIAPNLAIRRNRKARIIQNFFKHNYWKILLKKRFKLRKALLIFTRAKKQLMAMYIQRAYRSHVAWEKWKKEEARKFYAQQRQKGDLVIANVCKIQLNWRRNKNPRMFSKHVLLIARRIVRRANLKLYTLAMHLQMIGRKWLKKRHDTLAKLRLKSCNTIYVNTKAFLLKLAVWDRVQATYYKKCRVATLMKRCFRRYLLYRCLKIRFALRQALWNHQLLLNNACIRIQRFLTGKISQYFSAVRIAGRRQLKKRREKDLMARRKRVMDKGARYIVSFIRSVYKWKTAADRIHVIRLTIRRNNLERKSAISIAKYVNHVRMWKNFSKACKERADAKEALRIKILHTKASNVIGRYWKRYGEKYTLNARFKLRRKMLNVYEELRDAREIAEKERLEALDDVRRTEENMAATIAASWKQGADERGRNYYYNYVTGESSWIPPDNWKGQVLSTWIRNRDDRLNVYYYNMQTGESSWLPPCAICGEQAHRWCSECDVAYCEKDYDNNHGDEADDSMRNHTWSLTEMEKDVLKMGEQYCIDCKRRTASKICNTCWDAYCDECFKLAHHAGNLRLHKGIPYKRAKAGWMVVPGRAGDPDYYVNGSTGVTTFDKPDELLTPSERVYRDNYLVFKNNSDEHIKLIEKLQYDVEAASYERDTVIFEALNGGGNLGALLAKRAKANKSSRAPVARPGEKIELQSDVIANTLVTNRNPPGFFSKLIYGDKRESREDMLNPETRRRGAARSDYLKSLTDEVENKKNKKS